jgi:Tol biopolymer transport system component
LALTPGTRLGVYEITAPIGEGGMGQVFRARDTKLDRDVAIKVLPEAFAHDADRLARFTREAKTLASLNHPYIAGIYGLEESGGVSALVMELVEGEDLSQRIARGLIPLDEALSIAMQIAEALEAAHEQGIIHRDLKPANIKVRADGTVKVLDFGLAKAMDPAGSGASVMNSPTISMHATQAGIILGTAAYMSPEQARGTLVDKRADIWAFGAVVSEMLIGRRLFEGDTVSDTIASVLRQEIDWAALPPATPSTIVSLLHRCLERDPKRRLRDIGEARVVIEALGQHAAGSSIVGSGPSAIPAHQPAVIPTPRPSAVPWISTAALFVALVVVSIGLWRSTRAADAPVLRLSSTMPGDLTFDLTLRPMIAVSRDGATLAITAIKKGSVQTQLFVRRLKDFDAQPLAGTDGASSPFFSPDGAWIGFVADGKLKKIPAEGGPAIALAGVADSRGAVWTDRDTIVFTPDSAGGLMEVPGAGGTPRAITTIDEKRHERTHRWPSLMPDGKTILFTVGDIEHPDDYDDATIEAFRTDTGERRIVQKGGRASRYVATGDLLYVRGKILYAAAFDEKTLQVHGSARPVVDGVSGDTTTGAANFAVSATGSLAYVPGDPSGGLRRLAWVDLQGKVEPIDAPPALYADPHVSPDGRRIAVTIVAGGSRDIWIVDATRGTSSRMTFGGTNYTPIWSRDGERLYYVVLDVAKNTATILERSADGSGDPQRVKTLPGAVYLESLGPDGTTLTMSGVTAANSSVIYQTTLNDAAPRVMVSSAGNNQGSSLSPNGRWFAYQSSESGRYEIYVRSLAAGGRSQVSTAGGTEPRWAPDGRALYYVKGSDLIAVPVGSEASFGAGRPKTLFAGLLPLLTDSGETYDVAAKPDRFLMLRPVDEQINAPEIRLVLNWFGDLRRSAPR